MKTVIYIETGKAHRVNDKQAERLVKSGEWKYAPKSVWKEQRKDGSK